MFSGGLFLFYRLIVPPCFVLLGLFAMICLPVAVNQRQVLD